MKQMLLSWWVHPAAWYQFWMPQSGPIGGIIMGIVVIIVLNLIHDSFFV